MSKLVIFIVITLLTSANSAHAQYEFVYPPVPVHDPHAPNTPRAETAIGISGNEVLVAYNVTGGRLHYSISQDGGASFPTARDIPFASDDCTGGFGSLVGTYDPMVARRANGDLVVGGIVKPLSASFYGIAVRRKPAVR